MTEEEVSELYIRLAFHYESTIARLLDKKLIDQDFVDRHRKSFYVGLLKSVLLHFPSSQPIF